MKRTPLLTYLLLFTLFFTSVPVCAQDAASWIRKLHVPQTDTVSLVFIGDIMQHGPQLTAAKTAHGYDWLHCFAPLMPRLKGADLSVANIETVFGGAPYSGYPVFSSPDALIPDLKTSGIQLLLTANNHICDQGAKGLKRSLDLFDSTGVLHTGVFRSMEERNQRYPLLITLKGMRIALLCYSYGTNGFAVPEPFVFNYMDTTIMAADIVRAQRLQADFIVACMHWGEEYQLKHNDEQEQLASFLTRKGVDIIIGSHPHVPQGIEVLQNDLNEIQHIIVYSLGNVVSNMTLPHTQIGLLAEVKLIKSGFYKAIAFFDWEWIATEQRREEGVRKYYALPLLQCTEPSASVFIQPDGTPLPSVQFRADTLPFGTIRYTLWKKPSI